MKKAPDAFRTISEVSDLLDTPAHVLRFWESKFYQIRPVKRAGGRRYYRPDDVALLAGIRLLLQDRGMTIRGVQKVLQEQGVRHVAGLAPDLPLGGSPVDEDGETIEDAAEVIAMPLAARAPVPKPEAAEPEEPADTPAETGDEAPVASTEAAPEPATEDDPATEGDIQPVEAPPAVSPAPPAAAAEAPLTSPRPVTPAAPQPMPLPRADEIADAAKRPVHMIRALPRDALAARRDRLAVLSRRIDALLDRMSEAAGAGRW